MATLSLPDSAETRTFQNVMKSSALSFDSFQNPNERMRRIKNNEAVKKSREKSRSRMRHTHGKIADLRNMNNEDTKKINVLKNEIEELKRLFFVHAGNFGGPLALTKEQIDFVQEEKISVKK